MDDLQIVVDLMQTVGMWVIGFALFWNERKAHEITRREHLHDLREVAELKQPLRRPESPDKSLVTKS